MDYYEAMEAIQFDGQEGSILRLSTMKDLLSLTANPQKGMRFIHVAGTNGKGSVSQNIYSILIEAGYNVGLYQSPSLVTFNERMQVNREHISDRMLINIANELKERLQGARLAPTEFEWITAIAFHYFFQQDCDIVILEVGLGGRLDATNMIDAPLVSVITKIGLDHQDVLGDTIEEISGEKAGIIKEKSPVVLYPLQEEGVLETIKAVSQEKSAELIIPSVESLEIVYAEPDSGTFNYKDFEGLELGMQGIHQFYNAMTSLEVIEALKGQYDFDISEEAIRRGLKSSRMLGRFDKVQTNPTIILDGAHNPQGVEALADSIRRLYPDKKVVAVVGVLKDKNLTDMIKLIDDIISSYILVQVDSARRFDLDEMAVMISSNSTQSVQKYETVSEAFKTALYTVKDDEIIVCFGSLYLMAEAYQLLND